MTASAGAGGRGAGRAAASPPRGAPGVPARGRLRDAAAPMPVPSAVAAPPARSAWESGGSAGAGRGTGLRRGPGSARPPLPWPRRSLTQDAPRLRPPAGHPAAVLRWGLPGRRGGRRRWARGPGARGAYLPWCCRGAAAPGVEGRSRAPGASAASGEARREPSVRPERSYSGRHVAAHAPGCPARGAGTGSCAGLGWLGRWLGPRLPPAPRLLPAPRLPPAPPPLLPRDACVGGTTRPSAPRSHLGMWVGTFGRRVASAGQTPKEAED